VTGPRLVAILLVAATLLVPAGRSPARPDKSVKAEVRDLIEDLGDCDVPRRYRAAKRLVEIGRPAIGPLRQAAADHPSEDVRQRAAIVAKDVERELFTIVREFGEAASDQRRMVTRLALTPDGRRVLTANGNGVTLWDVQTGEVVRTFDEQNRNNWALAISVDGKRAIGGGNDRTARVWDLETGKEIAKLAGHAQPVWGVALTADGKRAITGARDKAILIWDVDTGKKVGAFKPVDDRVRALALSPDGKYVAASHFTEDNKPGTLRLWDVESGKEVRTFPGHTLPITYVGFSADGKTLATAGHDGTARLWDPATGHQLKKFTVDKARTEFAVLSPDGRWLITGGTESNTVVRVYDVEAGTVAYSTEPFQQGFLCAAILPDGHSAVVGGRDGMLRMWRWK
jgi:WD40 repeat protein